MRNSQGGSWLGFSQHWIDPPGKPTKWDKVKTNKINLLVFLSVSNHLLDLRLTQTTRVVCDGDLALVAGFLLLVRDVEDAVGVKIKRDLNSQVLSKGTNAIFLTSIWGTPRGSRGIPLRSNLPKRLQSWTRKNEPDWRWTGKTLVKTRPPSYTWMDTAGWMSENVLKTWNKKKLAKKRKKNNLNHTFYPWPDVDQSRRQLTPYVSHFGPMSINLDTQKKLTKKNCKN